MEGDDTYKINDCYPYSLLDCCLPVLILEYGVRTGRNEVNFPPSSSSFHSMSRIEISSAAIASQNIQGSCICIHAAVGNFDYIAFL